MKIEPSGVILTGVCDIQTAVCTALTPAPITAVWTYPGRQQVNVCRSCLEEKVRQGDWEIPGARLQRRYDAAVYAPSGQLQLVVEVKLNAPSSPDSALAWACKVHKNLTMHSGINVAPYFLLVGYPEHFFVWRGHAVLDPSARPDFEYHDPELLRPYHSAVQTSDQELPEAVRAEKAVTLWLESLAGTERLPTGPSSDWIGRSGLLEAIRGGTVMRQSALAA